MNLKNIYVNWKITRSFQFSLNSLLQRIPGPEKPLEERIVWLQNLITWIHKSGFIATSGVTLSSKIQSFRLNSLIHQLEINEDLNDRFGKTIASIFLQTDAVYLLSAIGLVDQDSILLDLSKRIHIKILPRAPEYNNLAFIIRNNFKSTNDYFWLTDMPAKGKNTLFHTIFDKTISLSLHFRKQAIESIYLLCSQSAGFALHNELRTRMRPHQLSDSPFFQMETHARQLINYSSEDEFAFLIQKLESTCLVAREFLRDVPIYLKVYGVDVNIVFKIEKIEGQFVRILLILSLMGKDKVTPELSFNFLNHLIAESVRRQSVVAFARDRFTLLSRRMTERSAETGEHYIARNMQDFFILFKNAIGGGVITAFTVMAKFICALLMVNGLPYGIAASFNYCISFLVIHFFGFTLATKQPAMTASTLAEKMFYTEKKDSLHAVCDEIIHLVRSQMIAVLGNMIAVVITTFLLCSLYEISFNSNFINSEKALHTIESLTFFGMTPLYAIFTGVILFVSSIFAGYMDNWFVYHQLENALGSSSRMQFILGKTGALKFSAFCKQNITGIASNISLGIMLGFTPFVGAFLNLPLDVRHVTLSSGALATSVFQLGVDSFKLYDFWFAILGIISMAVLNISVSFTLALTLAVRSKKVAMPKRMAIYKEILSRWKKNPFIIFIPPKL